MTEITPEQEASYALDHKVDRDILSLPAQAEYDRLKLERASRALPLTIAERSPVDRTRLRFAGIGILMLGLGCIFGAGGGWGIFFGIVFLALGAVTIYLTRFGLVPWQLLSHNEKLVVGIGTAIGLAWLGIFFLWLYILWVAARTVLKWMQE